MDYFRPIITGALTVTGGVIGFCVEFLKIKQLQLSMSLKRIIAIGSAAMLGLSAYSQTNDSWGTQQAVRSSDIQRISVDIDEKKSFLPHLENILYQKQH